MSGIYIDISEFQAPEAITYAQYVPYSAQGDGTSRIALRVDQGTGTPDKAYVQHYSRALAGGVKQFIHYHTVYPGLNPNWAGAQAEVNSFLYYLGGRNRPGDILMADFEHTTAALSGPPDWLWDFLHMLSAAASWPASQIALYANLATVQAALQYAPLAQFQLIVAAWNNTRIPPANVQPWANPLAWQYGDQAQVPGVSVPVDINLWLGPPEGPTSAQKIQTALDSITASVATIKSLL